MLRTVTPEAEAELVGGELLRGSLFMLRRKCGKAACHCSGGEDLHETPALAYPAGGRTKTLTLRNEDVAAVTAALGGYAAARQKLEAQADAGVAALRALVAARRDRERAR